VACTEHSTELLDQCGRCGSSVHGFALGLAGLEKAVTSNGEPPFVHCVSCGWDLRRRGVLAGEADHQLIQVQRLLEDLVLKWQTAEADPRDYFWMLHHAAELFAKELGTIPFEFLKARHRASVLERSTWLLDGDRWRYIQSVCSAPRPAIGIRGQAAQKPAGRASDPLSVSQAKLG
jgi:hypothetical protein